MPVTPNHGWTTPTVGASADTWGGLLNAVVDDQDALLSGGQNTILGRITSGTGPMVALTSAQATSALTPFTGDSGMGGAKGLVPAPAAGDAANQKALLAGGFWGYAGPAAIGRFVGSTGGTVVARGLSVVRTGVGLYTVTLSPALPNTNYVIQVIPESSFFTATIAAISSRTTSGFMIDQRVVGSTPFDPDFLNIAIFNI